MNAATPLRAATRIPLAEPAAVAQRLRAHFREHGAVEGGDADWSVAFDVGSARTRLSAEGLAVDVEAPDPTSLAFMQWSVAEHVYEFSTGPRPQIAWEGGIAAGQPLPYFREMRVVQATAVTPHMRRVTLAGDDLARFAMGGMHVRLLLPPRPGVRPVWPVMAADGRQGWPEGERPASRVYTLRRIDVQAGEVEIDFVLHEGDAMPGARFGMEAEPGTIVGMTGPGGGALKPAPACLLLGDETALPVIGRMLDEMPGGTPVRAIVEVADAGEIQPLRLPEGAEIRWLTRDGRPAGSTTLLADALRGVEDGFFAQAPFVFAGCEHAAARDIRSHLKTVRRHPRDRFQVAAYWRLGRAGED